MRGLHVLCATHTGSSDQGTQTTHEKAILVPTEELLVLWVRAGGPVLEGPSLPPNKLYEIITFNRLLNLSRHQILELLGGQYIYSIGLL